MLSREQDWAPDNGFASHNWWHLALFHIEYEDFPSAVRLYDEKVIPEDSDITTRMLDATALLWRLHLQGVDVGERWNRIADMWARKAPVENGYYAFNDLHAVISFLGAGRTVEARAVLAAVEAAAEKRPTTLSLRFCGTWSSVGLTRRKKRECVAPLNPCRSPTRRCSR